MRVFDGLEKANSGLVKIEDRVIDGLGSNCDFVFQQDNLPPWCTILENTLTAQKLAAIATILLKEVDSYWTSSKN